jgi:hypothetical protein
MLACSNCQTLYSSQYTNDDADDALLLIYERVIEQNDERVMVFEMNAGHSVPSSKLHSQCDAHRRDTLIATATRFTHTHNVFVMSGQLYRPVFVVCVCVCVCVCVTVCCEL